MTPKGRTKVGGSQKPGDLAPGEVFAQRMREVREKKGWTLTELARRLGDLGSTLQRSTLAKIEGAEPARSRRVTLEEVLLISYALDVSPLHMIVPLTDLRSPRVIVGPGYPQPADPPDLRAWLKGEEPLFDQNRMMFALERPASEIPKALERMPDVAHQLQQSWRPPSAERREER